MDNLKLFQVDLNNGMSIEEALKKYNLTFKDAFQQLHFNKHLQHEKKQRYKRKNPIKHQYIQERKGKYYLRKSKKCIRNGEKRHVMLTFGTYKTLEDAQRMREALKKDGWHQRHVQRICDELGIKRSNDPRGSRTRYQ